MQQTPFHAIFIALTVSAASAGPLTLTQDGYPNGRLVGASAAVSPNRAPHPAPGQTYAQAYPTRQGAANGPNLGGGIFEALFGGAAFRNAPQAYEPTQRYETSYGPSAYAPSADPARPAVDPRYLKQEVRYDGKEKPGTIIIDTNEKMLY